MNLTEQHYQIAEQNHQQGDDGEALKFYTLAAEENHPGALFRLGEFYDHALGGLDCSKEKALEYFRRSAALGCEAAREPARWLAEHPEYCHMVDGKAYDPCDPELRERCEEAYKRLCEFNATGNQELLRQEFKGNSFIDMRGKDASITPPFLCDYGENIHLGARSYINRNCLFLDSAPIYIGSDVIIDSGVQVLTATHPTDAAERNRGMGLSKPVHIGDSVWIGAGAIICPGVTIGSKAVIRPGSVVFEDVPAGAIVAGNPAVPEDSAPVIPATPEEDDDLWSDS